MGKNGNGKRKTVKAVISVLVAAFWLVFLSAFAFSLAEKRLYPLFYEREIIGTAEKYGIERRGGFLYLAGKEIPVLRVPENLNGEIRDIEYICAEELALGIKELLRLNRSAEKNGLFRLVVNQLGHTRADDASVEKLEEALALLNGEIEIRGDIISLK